MNDFDATRMIDQLEAINRNLENIYSSLSFIANNSMAIKHETSVLYSDDFTEAVQRLNKLLGSHAAILLDEKL